MISGKIVTKKEPLFPRYLFVRTDLENTNWTSLRSTRGVSNFVEFGNGPKVVDPNIINELKKVELLPRKPFIKTGEKIKIVKGSFSGLKAVYQNMDGASRSYILLEFMQQDQHMSIDNNFIKKI